MHELNDPEGAVEVRRMEYSPLLAKTVLVRWLREETHPKCQITEITYMLSARYNNKIVTKGQNLIFNFYGLKATMKVSEVDTNSENIVTFLSYDVFLGTRCCTLYFVGK